MGAATNKNEILQRRLKKASKVIIGAANTTDGDFYMLVDRSNGNGNWKHTAATTGQGIRIYAARAVACSATAADLYRVDIGVVLEADATDASVALIGAVNGYENYFPNYIDLTVASGKLSDSYASLGVVDTVKIQTDTALKDPQANDVLPAVGDVVFRVISTKGSPAGSIALAEATVWYDVAKVGANP